MRKILLLLSFFFGMTLFSNAQIHTSCYFDDFWGEWTPAETLRAKGDFDNFIIYDESVGPWGYFLRVKINNFSVIPPKQRKKDLKEKDIVKYEYSGTVEYYLPDYGGNPNTTIYDLFKYAKKQFFWPKERTEDSQPPVKRIVSNATIRIYRYENFPQYYVIYFDKVGAGFYLDKNYFTNSAYHFNK